MEITPFRGLISFSESLKRLLQNTEPVKENENVSLLDANSRVVGEEVKSPIDVPPFDRAAVDGYAVRAKETFDAGVLNPVKFKVVGEVYAGGFPDKEIKSKEAFMVATGAPIPNGSDSVVMAEDTEEKDGLINVYRSIPPFENVTKRGSDMEKGEVIIKTGEVLTPSRVGALASAGVTEVNVKRRVRVSVIPTGEEIVRPGEGLQKGKIYDINTYTISSLLKELGSEVFIGGFVGDRIEDLKKAVEEWIKRSDIVVLTGGSSVGERDLLKKVFELKGKVLFHGVQIKPGKPTLAAKRGNKLLIGIPGYPASALTASYLLLRPVVLKMAGYPVKSPQVIRAKLSRRITSNLGRHQFLTVKLQETKEGFIAHPAFKESGTITSLSKADGYVQIPENVDLMEKGEEVAVSLF